MKKKVIIYDFDGVIVDSRQAVFSYYDEIFSHFNIPLIDWRNDENGKHAYGMTDQQLFEHYADPETAQKMREYVPNMTEEQLLAITPLEKGAKEAFELFSKKYNLAICTNRGMSVSMYLAYYGITNYFSYVVTSHDVLEPKPAPEGVNKILGYFNITPEDAIYVGDSETDYLAAQGATVKFIAFGGNLHGAPVITNHMQLLEYL